MLQKITFLVRQAPGFYFRGVPCCPDDEALLQFCRRCWWSKPENIIRKVRFDIPLHDDDVLWSSDYPQ